jgi:uncharacterized membrane-anchored protein
MYSFTENTPNRSCDTTSTSYEIDASKVPQVTLAFWVIKVAATTLGETGGGRLSMTMHLGYTLSNAVFFTLFVVTVAAQVAFVSSFSLLERHRRDDDRRDDDGGLC